MELAPAFPIIEVSRELILAAINETLNDNTTSGVNKSWGMTVRSAKSFPNRETTPAMINPLVKRDAEPCAANQPCPDERWGILRLE